MRPIARATLVAAFFLAGTPCASALSPDQACQIAKLRAGGAEVQARLLCEVRSFATGADPACLAAAAERRDEAFRAAEARGGCSTVGDSSAIGQGAAYVVDQDVLAALRPAGPAPSSCTQRQFALAGRAAVRLTGLYAYDERAHDQARLVERLDRARTHFIGAYQRATALGDCLYTYPGDQFYDSFAYGIGNLLRDALCPSCGVICPCWTTAQLDRSFPPGAFAALGGTSCGFSTGEQLVVGVFSQDSCSDPRVGAWPRSGALVLTPNPLCLTAVGSICNFPSVQSVTAEEAAACTDALRATKIYRQECRVPN